MASYHRVLNAFGRSVNQRTVQCNCDIHPWDIFINNERWSGKIRLIGFVDVFFLICYSGESRFQHGIIVYKNEGLIRETLKNAKIDPDEVGLPAVSRRATAEKTDEGTAGQNDESSYFAFTSDAGGSFYKITGVGHEIDLKTCYDPSSLNKYRIELRKDSGSAVEKQILRGLTQHSIFGLMQDAVRLHLLSPGELIGTALAKTMTTSAMEDMTSAYQSVLASARGSRKVELSPEKK